MNGRGGFERAHRGHGRARGRSWTDGTTRLHDYVLELTGKSNPAVLFLGTATGDDPGYIVSFYETFNSARCRPRHLNLFNREHDDITELMVGADVVHVGGGNTANMLDVWKRQGVDLLLHQALARGAVLTGGSAGGICWFEGGTTDSYGPTLRALSEGLGMVKGSFCPHYDSGRAAPAPVPCCPARGRAPRRLRGLGPGRDPVRRRRRSGGGRLASPRHGRSVYLRGPGARRVFYVPIAGGRRRRPAGNCLSSLPPGEPVTVGLLRLVALSSKHRAELPRRELFVPEPEVLALARVGPTPPPARVRISPGRKLRPKLSRRLWRRS